MHTVVKKIGCLELRMFCRVLAGGFREHVFLKSTCTDFGGGGLVQVVLERTCDRQDPLVVASDVRPSGGVGSGWV
jgi:hypothetical protein